MHKLLWASVAQVLHAVLYNFSLHSSTFSLLLLFLREQLHLHPPVCQTSEICRWCPPLIYGEDESIDGKLTFWWHRPHPWPQVGTDYHLISTAQQMVYFLQQLKKVNMPTWYSSNHCHWIHHHLPNHRLVRCSLCQGQVHTAADQSFCGDCGEL